MLRLETARFDEGVDLIKRHLQEGSVLENPFHTASTTTLEELKSARDSALGKLSDSPDKEPWEEGPLATASYLSACYRDAKYAMSGRRYHQQLGLASFARGYLEGARHAEQHDLG